MKEKYDDNLAERKMSVNWPLDSVEDEKSFDVQVDMRIKI